MELIQVEKTLFKTPLNSGDWDPPSTLDAELLPCLSWHDVRTSLRTTLHLCCYSEVLVCSYNIENAYSYTLTATILLLLSYCCTL